jgi:cytochrome P450
MSAELAQSAVSDRNGSRLAEGETVASPAGPVQPGSAVHLPPSLPDPRYRQTLGFLRNPLDFHLSAARTFGDVWAVKIVTRDVPIVVTCHPDHVKSLFVADPADAPSLTGDSPLRPILGPTSVLTLVGDQHMRLRKLLLPPFHGEAVARYVEMISEVTERELDSWPEGKPFALARRMQAITMDVIMAGVFGIACPPRQGTAEYRMRQTFSRLMRISAHPLWALVELRNARRMQARGLLRATLAVVDRQVYGAIARRRAEQARSDRTDILSLLLEVRDEDGKGLTDAELRDQLLTLVLAGHETTANTLAWTFERMLRTPSAYDRLRELVRSDDDAADGYVEATIHEGMRMRPVVPLLARLVKRPWQLGEYVVPANTPVAISVLALHHREDIYPDPYTFRPERFIENKPGTYTWIAFGGGIRRCLGAELAKAEQRVVLRALARRIDLAVVDPADEGARQRNVTMIPRNGGRVVVQSKRAA